MYFIEKEKVFISKMVDEETKSTRPNQTNETDRHYFIFIDICHPLFISNA